MAEFDVGKVFPDHFHPSRVSYEDDDVGQFLRSEVDVESRSVVIDYQF